MNLPELITKLLIIERDLVQQGIEVNDVKVTALNYESLLDYQREIDKVEVDQDLVVLD